jgi:hypothetical protein
MIGCCVPPRKDKSSCHNAFAKKIHYFLHQLLPRPLPQRSHRAWLTAASGFVVNEVFQALFDGVSALKRML